MFAERRPLFLDRFENLKKALDCAYLRSLENADSLESMIFFTITAGPCTQDNMNLSSTIKSIQDIMCKDDGVDGNAQLRARDAAHCVAWRSGSSRVSQPEGRSSMPLTALILGPGIKAVKWRAERFHVIPLRRACLVFGKATTAVNPPARLRFVNFVMRFAFLTGDRGWQELRLWRTWSWKAALLIDRRRNGVNAAAGVPAAAPRISGRDGRFVVLLTATG